MSSLRIFLSYSSLNKTLAGKMKRYLNNFGIEVFLAHESINPSEEWQDVILENLFGMDVFIALLTKEFKKSEWTNQESGIAICSSVLIIPVNVDLNPYGFLSKYQAVKFNKTRPTYSFKKIINILYEKQKVKFLDTIINYFGQSDSYIETHKRVKIINQFDGYNLRQLNKILEVGNDNYQIYNSYNGKHLLRTIINKNQGLNQRYITAFRKKYNNVKIENY